MKPQLPLALLFLGAVKSCYAAPREFVDTNETVTDTNTSLAKRQAPFEMKKYLALGDSYAAGIGAGTFIDPTLLTNGEDHNKCARKQDRPGAIFHQYQTDTNPHYIS